MQISRTALIAISVASLWSAGCATAESPRETPRDTPAQAARQPAAPPDEFVVRDEESRDRDKRGNTPPGLDRSGGGPTSGAIVDPAGAVTRTPAPRER